MLSSGRGRHVSSVYCASILCLHPTVGPDADLYTSSPAREEAGLVQYLLSLFPHRNLPNLQPRQLLFSVRHNLFKT